MAQARIDSHKKLLYAKHADARKTTFQKAVAMGVPRSRSLPVGSFICCCMV